MRIVICLQILTFEICGRTVATYGAETWPLTAVEENALGMFERKLTRRIYGPVMESNVWRIRYNEEINA
jgi:hypothetical protein